MSKHTPHFPVAILTHNGELILDAAQTHPEITARLSTDYLTSTSTALDKVTSDVTGQRTKRGDLGNLTAAQRANLDQLQHWMNLARQTAKLAFPGQTVKLHQEFQVGVTGQYDLASFLSRADILLASVQNADNLAALKLKGWTDADTQAFVAARKSLGTASTTQQDAKGKAKDATGLKHADASDLYERLLTIQNAANLQWPATDPANAGVRAEFRLDTFPPTSSSGNSQPPAPSPTPAPQAASATAK